MPLPILHSNMAKRPLSSDDLNEPPRKRVQRGRPSTKRPQAPGVPKQWQCNWEACPKSFGRKSDLIRHHHTHTGTRNHKCHFPGCGKTFIQTSALTVHTRTHTGEKPHECNVCGKRFSDSSSLARHRRIHSNKRPYPCNVAPCDKSFCRKSTLSKHMDRDHLGVAHSPDTDDSDDDSTTHAQQTQAPSNPSTVPPPSQSPGIDVRNRYMKPDPSMFSSNPRHLRPIARSNISGAGYYPHAPFPTPVSVGWQAIPQSQRQGSLVSRAGARLPLLKTYQTMIFGTGPVSAPVAPSDPQYLPSQDTPQSARFVPGDFTQDYFQDVSPGSNSVYQQDVIGNQMHQSTLPSTTEAHGDAQRVLQAHIKAEQLLESPQPDMFAYASQGYQEPVDLGITQDYTAQYQLPSTDLNSWAINQEDKYQDTFGEATPGQFISLYNTC